MKRSTKRRKAAGQAAVRKVGRSWDSPHEIERITGLVCHYFCKGYSPAAIASRLEQEHRIKISREAPYRYLSYATTRNWLRFTPPSQVLLAEQLRSRYRHLQQVDVVDATMAEGIMERAADVVMDLVLAKAQSGKSVVHIGFAGGRSMALLASKLAPRLHEAHERMPTKIICQNLVAGFDIRDPKSNPISFLSLLTGAKANGLQVESILFQAPAIVYLHQRAELLQLPGIKEAAEAAWKADIIVTSCGGFDDPHQMLRKYYEKYADTLSVLKARGCVGDMLWLPVCREAPFRFDNLSEEEKLKLGFRSMSLIELYDLPAFIQGGTQVVLAVAPCMGCRREKAEIFRAILEQNPHLVTHVIADFQSAHKVLVEK